MNDKTFQFRCDEEILRKLKGLEYRFNISQSDVLRMLILEATERPFLTTKIEKLDLIVAEGFNVTRTVYRCGNCGYTEPEECKTFNEHYKFCPHCGAKIIN